MDNTLLQKNTCFRWVSYAHLVLLSLSFIYCGERETADQLNQTVDDTTSSIADGSDQENTVSSAKDPKDSTVDNKPTDDTNKSSASADSGNVGISSSGTVKTPASTAPTGSSPNYAGRALVTFGVAKMAFSPEVEERIVAGETLTDKFIFNEASRTQYYVPLSEQDEVPDPIAYAESKSRGIEGLSGRVLLKRSADNHMVITPAFLEDIEQPNYIVSETYGSEDIYGRRVNFWPRYYPVFTDRWILNVTHVEGAGDHYTLHNLQTRRATDLSAAFDGTVLADWNSVSWRYAKDTIGRSIPSVIPSPDESLMLFLSAGLDKFGKLKGDLTRLALIDPLKPSSAIHLTADTEQNPRYDRRGPTTPVWVNNNTFYWTKGNQSSITKCQVPFRLEVTCTDYLLALGNDERPTTIDELFVLPGYPDHLVARVSVKPDNGWWTDHFELFDFSGKSLRRVQLPLDGVDANSDWLDVNISPSGRYVAFQVHDHNPTIYYIDHDTGNAKRVPTPYIDGLIYDDLTLEFSPNPNTDQMWIIASDTIPYEGKRDVVTGAGYQKRISLLQFGGAEAPTHLYVDSAKEGYPASEPYWSPDGSWLIYMTRTPENYNYRPLYAVNLLNGTKNLPYTGDPIARNGYESQSHFGGSPVSAVSAWSTDWLQIYYVARKSTAQPYGSLYITDISASGEQSTVKVMDLAINDRITSLEENGFY